MTTVDITYITGENVGNIDLLEILSQSRDTYTMWVCDQAHFKKILWADIPDGDLVALQTRFTKVALGKFLMGVTDQGDIWIYAGDLINELTTFITEHKWILIADAFTGMLEDTERLLTIYHTNVTPTTNQIGVANFIMETLMTGLTVDGIVHWFITTTNLTGRKVFSFCEGDTTAVILPDGWTSVDLIKMIEGGKNSITAKNGDTTYTGYIDDTAVIQWLISEAITNPGIQPIAPTPGN